jgi:hypothetical protein
VAFELTILITIFYSILGVVWKFKGFLIVLFFIFLALLMIYFAFFSNPTKDPISVLTDYWMIVLVITFFITLFYNASDDMDES